MEFHHQTVLRDAVVELLQAGPGGQWLDGTLGGGGHSEALLQATGPDGRVLGLDRDPAALAAARQRLAGFGPRFEARHGRFGDLSRAAGDAGPFRGIVLDLGVSSPQLDQAHRGFSFQQDGPVDMRMDPSSGLPASEWLEDMDHARLARLIGRLGDEPRAGRIARAILDGRPWRSTRALAECVAKASGYRNSRTHPATRTFQALRIHTNDELGELDRGLRAALDALEAGGRLAVISFHSLEDRATKAFFRASAGIGTPRDAYGHPATPPVGRLVNRKPINGLERDPHNPRARSARLRVFERTQPTIPPAAPADEGHPGTSSPGSH